MSSSDAITIHRFAPQPGELLERFLALRESIYADDYFAYPETGAERMMLGYYAARRDYRFELLLAERAGRDVARVLVGRNQSYEFAFFGFFECANDLDVFRALMENACGVARETGLSELRGPIELNALHGWCFLDASETGGRWIGDPYHRAYYPALFRAEGWPVADRSVSGVVHPSAHLSIRKMRGEAEEKVAQLGIKVYRLGEVPEERLLEDAWRLVCDTFTTADHRYVPIELPVFRAQTATVLAHLKDPASFLAMYRDDECVGFLLSYANFIDEVCNRDGRKVRPDDRALRTPFSMKTTAVSARYRKAGVWSALLSQYAEHAEQHYGHPTAWRRTNVRNAPLARLRDNARITESYVTFHRAL